MLCESEWSLTDDPCICSMRIGSFLSDSKSKLCRLGADDDMTEE